MNDEKAPECHCGNPSWVHKAHELEFYKRKEDGGPAYTWTDDKGENWNNGPWERKRA